MEKKIIGFRLIKRYPDSPALGTELMDSIKFCDTDTWGGIRKEELLCLYKEFWEPIYGKKALDLNEIIDDYELHSNSLIVINIRAAMREACRQTLELVKKHARIEYLPKNITVDLRMTYESIDNILTMIK